MHLTIHGDITYPSDQLSHGPATGGVTSCKVSSNVGRVANTLNGQVGQTNSRGKVVEEDWSNGSRVSDVASLGGSTGVDHRDRATGCAVNELVVSARAELPGLESGDLGIITVEVVLEVGLKLGQREVIIESQGLGVSCDGSSVGNCRKGNEDLSWLHDELPV